MKIYLKFLSLLMIASAVLFSSFTLISYKKSATKTITVDENVEVTIGSISGPNSVGVYFNRTGPDAGDGAIEVTYKVKFNDGLSNQRTETFTHELNDGETTRATAIPGPDPTFWAEVIEVSWVYL
jgi:hypothetical protein